MLTLFTLYYLRSLHVIVFYLCLRVCSTREGREGREEKRRKERENRFLFDTRQDLSSLDEKI